MEQQEPSSVHGSDCFGALCLHHASQPKFLWGGGRGEEILNVALIPEGSLFLFLA